MAALTIVERHGWSLSASEARALQTELAKEARTDVPLGPVKRLAAADVSFDRGSDVLYSAVVVVDFPTMAVVESVGTVTRSTFPYVPGLLSFREAPALLGAFALLKEAPDAVVCDGQGRAHPRRLGIACHLGLWLGLPTVGSGKSKLVGTYEGLGPARGDRVPLVDRGERVGTVLRTRLRSNPLFVSPGHLCDLESAEGLVMACLDHRRLPVPQRLAHEEVNRLRVASKAAPLEPGPRDG